MRAGNFKKYLKSLKEVSKFKIKIACKPNKKNKRRGEVK